jgi:hypothetical protein
MTKTMVAAGVFGLLAGAVLLAPTKTFARAGGGFAARSMGAHIAPRLPVVRPPVRPSAALPNGIPRPLARTPQATPVKEAAVHAFRTPLQRQHVFGFGLPITVLGGSAFYGTTYDPADDVVPYEVPYFRPAYPDPATVGYPGATDTSALPGEPRQCRAQVVTVPNTRGGQQSITIVRC